MTAKTMLFAASLLLCLWSWSVYAQEGIGLTLNNVQYTNNSVVNITDIGTGSAALLCTTTYSSCCSSANSETQWYLPNGSQVLSNPNMTFSRTRSTSPGTVRLNRNPEATTTGVFRCDIPDASGDLQSLYVGIYTAYRIYWPYTGGSPYITSLGYDNQSRTLTCTSTGGPATTVTWRRNENIITLNATHQQTQIVTNATTSTYQTLLTISQSVGQSVFAGLYNCTVENNRGRSSLTRVVAVNGVSVWLRGTNYQNNSLVTLEDIGQGDAALFCITDLTACCRYPYTYSVGNWFFPNGTRAPSRGVRWNFHRTRGHMSIALHRREGGEEGIYHCLIPDAMNVTQTIYIGVYTASTGQVTIPGEITFQLDTDPATDPPVFTLTCTSTGGPATTVSWRRDGTLLSDGSTYSINSEVTDGTTATYNHTLTVTGRLVGEYQCSVSNIRTPSGSSRSLTVGVPDPPTGLSATQVGPTSIRVSWTAPVSGGTVTAPVSEAAVTGYRIFYSGGTDQGSVDVGASATEHTIIVPQPQNCLTYSISIITLSSQLPSSMAGPIMATVGSMNIHSQMIGVGSLVGAVVGTFIGTTLLYAVILIAWILWNKRKTRKDNSQEKQLDTDIAMKECAAYGGVTAHSVMEDVYEHPQ